MRRRYEREDEQGREPRQAMALWSFQCAEAMASWWTVTVPVRSCWCGQRLCNDPVGDRRVAGSAMDHADDAMSTCHATPVPVPLVHKAASPQAHPQGTLPPTPTPAPRPRCASHQDHLPLAAAVRPRASPRRNQPERSEAGP